MGNCRRAWILGRAAKEQVFRQQHREMIADSAGSAQNPLCPCRMRMHHKIGFRQGYLHGGAIQFIPKPFSMMDDKWLTNKRLWFLLASVESQRAILLRILKNTAERKKIERRVSAQDGRVKRVGRAHRQSDLLCRKENQLRWINNTCKKCIVILVIVQDLQ